MKHVITKPLPLFWALLPIILLMVLLSYNVLVVYHDDATSGFLKTNK